MFLKNSRLFFCSCLLSLPLTEGAPPPVPPLPPEDCSQILEVDPTRDFYNHLPLDAFRTRAKACGIVDKDGKSVDLNQPCLREIIQTAERVLVVGPGFGRELKHLLDLQAEIGFPKQIFAVDLSDKNCNYLHSQFDVPVETGATLTDQRLVIWHSDIIDFRLPNDTRVDLAIFQFGGIFELSPRKKDAFFDRMKKIVRPRGKLALDMPANFVPVAPLMEVRRDGVVLLSLAQLIGNPHLTQKLRFYPVKWRDLVNIATPRGFRLVGPLGDRAPYRYKVLMTKAGTSVQDERLQLIFENTNP